MKEVWILFYEIDYEGREILAIFDGKPSRKDLEELVSADKEYYADLKIDKLLKDKWSPISSGSNYALIEYNVRKTMNGK